MREGIKYGMRRRNESGRAPLVRETVRETERFHLINPIMQSKYTVLMEHGMCVCVFVSIHKIHYRIPDCPSVLSASQVAFKLTAHTCERRNLPMVFLHDGNGRKRLPAEP